MVVIEFGWFKGTRGQEVHDPSFVRLKGEKGSLKSQLCSVYDKSLLIILIIKLNLKVKQLQPANCYCLT